MEIAVNQSLNQERRQFHCQNYAIEWSSLSQYVAKELYDGEWSRKYTNFSERHSRNWNILPRNDSGGTWMWLLVYSDRIHIYVHYWTRGLLISSRDFTLLRKNPALRAQTHSTAMERSHVWLVANDNHIYIYIYCLPLSFHSARSLCPRRNSFNNSLLQPKRSL